MQHMLAYQAPSFTGTLPGVDLDENEVIPAFIIAAAKAVGISAALAAWICTVPCAGQCRSLWSTIRTLGKWLTVGC